MNDKPNSQVNNKSFNDILGDIKSLAPPEQKSTLNTDALVAQMKLAIRIQRLQYILHVEAGFTPEQALYLIKANPQK